MLEMILDMLILLNNEHLLNDILEDILKDCPRR